MQPQPLPESIRNAIRTGTNLAYLFHKTEAVPYTLQKASAATVHGGESKRGDFIRCLSTRRDLPAGTEGWLFIDREISYSKTVWHGDQWWPVPGATITETGCHYTFVTRVEVAGQQVVADVFKYVKHDEPKVIGTVGS